MLWWGHEDRENPDFAPVPVRSFCAIRLTARKGPTGYVDAFTPKKNGINMPRYTLVQIMGKMTLKFSFSAKVAAMATIEACSKTIAL